VGERRARAGRGAAELIANRLSLEILLSPGRELSTLTEASHPDLATRVPLHVRVKEWVNLTYRDRPSLILGMGPVNASTATLDKFLLDLKDVTE
jgi:hypothetical protein